MVVCNHGLQSTPKQITLWQKLSPKETLKWIEYWNKLQWCDPTEESLRIKMGSDNKARYDSWIQNAEVYCKCWAGILAWKGGGCPEGSHTGIGKQLWPVRISDVETCLWCWNLRNLGGSNWVSQYFRVAGWGDQQGSAE